MKLRKGKGGGRPAQPPTYPDKSTLGAMNVERERLGITLVEIATEAVKTTKRKRGTCSISTVSRTFSGDTKSRNILDAYKRLKRARLAQARESRNGAVAVAS